MLNAVKMDIYRGFKGKCIYVILICLAAFLVFSVALTKEDMQVQAEQEQFMEAASAGAQSAESIGLYVAAPAKDAQSMTVADEIFAHFSSRLVAIFVAVFAALFSLADIHTGFIKNIAGQIKKRRWLVFSKSIAIAIFTAVMTAVSVAVIVIAQAAVFKGLQWGNIAGLLSYIGAEYLLYTSFGLIIMCLSMLIKNSTVSVTLGICLCMNVQLILYGFLDNAVNRLGIENFNISSYTVTGNMALLTTSPDITSLIRAAAVAVCFGAAAVTVTVLMFRRRDI